MKKMTVLSLSIFLFAIFVGMNTALRSKNVEAETHEKVVTENSQWAYFYQGPNGDSVNAVTQTSDGGFVLVGATDSFGSGNMDLWVIKIDAEGNILWEKTYGDGNLETANDVAEAENGDLLIVGTMFVYPPQGIEDGYRILRLSATGEVIWQKQFDKYSDKNSILVTVDQGIVVAGGWSPSGPSDLTSIVKLDLNGNFLWQKLYNEPTFLYDGTYFSIDETPNGDFIASFPTEDWAHQWIARLDSQGNIEWQKFLDGPLVFSFTVNAIGNDGFYVSGRTQTNTIILRLDPAGNIVWQKSLSTSTYISIWSAAATHDGGIILVGNLETPNYFVVRLDANGNLLWSHSYAGGRVQDVAQTTDEGFIVVGSEYVGKAAAPYPWALTDENGMTRPEAIPTLDGNDDILVFKVDANGNIHGCELVSPIEMVITDTNILLAEAFVTPIAITPIILDTLITPQTSDVTPIQACYFMASPTPSITPSASPTHTLTPSPTYTQNPTATSTPSPTATHSPTPTLTTTPTEPSLYRLYLPFLHHP